MSHWLRHSSWRDVDVWMYNFVSWGHFVWVQMQMTFHPCLRHPKTVFSRYCGVSCLLKEFRRGIPKSRSDTATSSVMVGVNSDRVLKWVERLCVAQGGAKRALVVSVWVHCSTKTMSSILPWPIAGWWFGTCFILPYIGNTHSNSLSYFSEG